MKIKKGFTLMELMTVLAIIAIVAVIAVPSIAGYNKNRQKKNCEAEMQMLYEEIENSLSSQRFSSTDEVDKEIVRTVLNHVQGASIKNKSGNSVALESYGSLKGSDGIVYMEVNNICTNGGTYKMSWATTGSLNFTVTGKLDDKGKFIQCTHDKDVSKTLNVACSSHVAKLSDSHFKRNVSKEAIQIYDKVQEYIKNNVSSTNIRQFMKDAPGCIGGSPDTTNFKLPKGFTNSEYNSTVTSDQRNKSALFYSSKSKNVAESDKTKTDLGIDLYRSDTIIALTVNHDTKVLEYLAVALSYDNRAYKNEDGSQGTVETYYISMFNDGGSIAYFDGDMGKYYPYINKDENVYSEKNISVQGSRGSYAANILWSETTEWNDFFDTEEETEAARTATEETTTVIEDDSSKITGPITRIGDYPDTGLKWNYYNKNWYYQDQEWLKNLANNKKYPRNNDVTLKNNISGGISYTESVSQGNVSNASSFSNYHELKDLVIDSSYDVVDGATATYNEGSTVNAAAKIYHNTAKMFKNPLNGYTNMNGFFYLNNIQTLYNPFDNQMIDEEEQGYISDYNSPYNTDEKKTIYLTYNEDKVTDQLNIVRTKNYEYCDFKIVDNGQEISPNNSVGIIYSRDKFKITGYYTAHINDDNSKPVRIKGDINLDSCADKLVIYDAKDINQKYEGINAENKLYSGGTYYVYIGLDKEDGTTTAPANKDGVDSSHLYYFEPSGVPDILYDVHTDSEGKNIATVLSIKQLDPDKNNTEKNESGNFVYYNTNVINIPSYFRGHWEKLKNGKSDYDKVSAEEKRNIRCFFVDPGEYKNSDNEYSRGANYYKYVKDDVHYEVTQIGDGAISDEALDKDFGDLRANVVYVPSIPTVKNLDYGNGTTRKGTIVDGWTICIPNTVKYIATGAFCERDWTATNSFKIENDNSLNTIQIFDNSTRRYIKEIKFAEGSQCEYIGAYAFYGDFNMLSINMPASVGNNIGQYAFGYCFNLHNISLSSNVTVIRKGTFLSCSALNSGMQWSQFLPQITSIGNYAFKDCYSMIGKLNLSSLKNLEFIGDYAFYNCHNISSIDIPETVTSIGNYAFAYITTVNGDESDAAFMYSKYIEDIRPLYAIDTTDDNSTYAEYRGNYNQRKTSERKLDFLAYDASAIYNTDMFKCTNYNMVYLPSGNNPNKDKFTNMKNITIIIRNYYSGIGINGDFNDNSLVIEQIGSGITDLNWDTTAFDRKGLFNGQARIKGNLFVQNVENRLCDAVFQAGDNENYSNKIEKYKRGTDYRGGTAKEIDGLDHSERALRMQFANGNLILKNVNALQTLNQQGSGRQGNPTSAFCMEYFDYSNIRTYGFKSIWLDNVKYIDNYSFDGCLFADYAIITHIDNDAVASIYDDINGPTPNNTSTSDIPFFERDEAGKIIAVNGIENAAFAAKPIYIDECEDKYASNDCGIKKNNRGCTNINGLIRGSLAGYYDNVDVSAGNGSTSFDISKIDSKKSSQFELYLPNELYIFAKIHQSEYYQKNTTNIFGADSIHPINTIGNIRESEYYALYQKEIEQCLNVNPDLFKDSSFAQDHPNEYGTIKTDVNTGKSTIKPFEIRAYDYSLDIDLVK